MLTLPFLLLLELSTVLEDVNNPMSSVRIFRQLKHERLDRTLTEMRLIAARRSGARGLKARKAVIALEAKVEASKSLYVCFSVLF
jgi:ATP-binding cassette subfamily F protein 3